MILSTVARMSSRVVWMICSAICSGSSWRQNSDGVPSLAIPTSTARLPIFAEREGTIPCQPIPPTISPGICCRRRGRNLASIASSLNRRPLNWTG